VINRRTGFKIAVVGKPGRSPFVVVPAEQLSNVRRVLNRKGIGHTVSSVIDGLDGPPNHLVMVHIGEPWDRERVQDALDSVG
jgi:hypothetical protein